MKIEKYIKDKSNKYKIIIDGETYTLYDDVIVKYQLIMKDTISKKELDSIISISESNVGDILSILISLATDNAKELMLAKIHASQELSNGLIAMTVLGFSIEEML